MRRVIESDVCIIGSGITAALFAEKFAEQRPNLTIAVVEAGDDTVPLAERILKRDRFMRYGESPWGNDHINDQTAEGIQSRSMQVGGMAMHWGGVTPRFSPEDFRLRTLYGVGDDWPITYDDLDPYYQEAEERMGVAGEQGPRELDPRGKPFPMPPIPLTYNLGLLKEWGAKAGIAFWSQPSAKNSVEYKSRAACCRNDTCSPICPIGAKYSPDFTWNALRRNNRFQLVTRTLVRKLVPAAGSARVERAIAVSRDQPNVPLEFRARTFIVAGGYAWSSHLLLLSADSRFPNGIANRSGLVGRYMAGHRSVSGFVRLPMKLFPGINEQHSLVTKQFMRPGALQRYLRHDLRLWESSSGRTPRLRNDANALMLGDEIMSDWRARTETGTARVRGYYDVIPDRNSSLTLDPTLKNQYGDPMPRLQFRDSAESTALRQHSEDSLRALFERMARAGNGELTNVRADSFQDHPAGGCRMGSDPSTSVTDSWGRTHDHENLFVIGAPTCVSASCCNGTLTFVALSLRSAAEAARSL